MEKDALRSRAALAAPGMGPLHGRAPAGLGELFIRQTSTTQTEIHLVQTSDLAAITMLAANPRSALSPVVRFKPSLC